MTPVYLEIILEMLGEQTEWESQMEGYFQFLLVQVCMFS